MDETLHDDNIATASVPNVIIVDEAMMLKENNISIMRELSFNPLMEYVDDLKDTYSLKADTDGIKAEVMRNDLEARELDIVNPNFINRGSVRAVMGWHRVLNTNASAVAIHRNSFVPDINDELLSDCVMVRLKELEAISYNWLIILLVRVLLPETVCGLVAKYFRSPKLIEIYDNWRDVDEFLFEVLSAVNDCMNTVYYNNNLNFKAECRFRLLSGNNVKCYSVIPPLAVMAMMVLNESDFQLDEAMVHHSWNCFNEAMKANMNHDYVSVANLIERLVFDADYFRLLFSIDDPEDARLTFYDDEESDITELESDASSDIDL